jgi:hypothetical protein
MELTWSEREAQGALIAFGAWGLWSCRGIQGWGRGGGRREDGGEEGGRREGGGGGGGTGYSRQVPHGAI